MAQNRKAVRIKKIARQVATRAKNSQRKKNERARKVAYAEVKSQRLAAKGVTV